MFYFKSYTTCLLIRLGSREGLKCAYEDVQFWYYLLESATASLQNILWDENN